MRSAGIVLISILIWGCDTSTDPPDPPPSAKDPRTAARAVVDRFSSSAGALYVRDSQNGLPGPNVPIAMDTAPFITRGLGPAGQKVRYYNFDVQPPVPKPVYVFFYESTGERVPGQLNIIGLIPGDAGYTDFWLVTKVFTPDDYTANSVTSEQGIVDAALRVQAENLIVNCPVVPEGSSAVQRLGGGDTTLHQGWYNDLAVFYFTFEEKELVPVGGTVPVSPIYVAFNVNPDQPGGGPASGFKTESGSDQTHNVIATLPSDASYSPLWAVNMYDNASFDSVTNLSAAQSAPLIVQQAALVNCPVVWIE